MKSLEDNWTLEFFGINALVSLVCAFIKTPQYLNAFKKCPEIFVDFQTKFGFELDYWSLFLMFFTLNFIFITLLMVLLALILGVITYLLLR